MLYCENLSILYFIFFLSYVTFLCYTFLIPFQLNLQPLSYKNFWYDSIYICFSLLCLIYCISIPCFIFSVFFLAWLISNSIGRRITKLFSYCQLFSASFHSFFIYIFLLWFTTKLYRDFTIFFSLDFSFLFCLFFIFFEVFNHKTQLFYCNIQFYKFCIYTLKSLFKNLLKSKALCLICENYTIFSKKKYIYKHSLKLKYP